MNALLVLFLLAGPDELAEARKLQGALLPPSAGVLGEGLKDVTGVWECSVMVTVTRRVEEVTKANLPGSAEDENRLQELLRPIAHKTGLARGLIDASLDTLDPELEIEIHLFPVDEETEETWSVEIRAQLVVLARVVPGGATARAPVWEMDVRGAVRQADLDTVLAEAVEHEVKVAAVSLKKARSARPRTGATP
jgi:hypothetical protein